MKNWQKRLLRNEGEATGGAAAAPSPAPSPAPAAPAPAPAAPAAPAPAPAPSPAPAAPAPAPAEGKSYWPEDWRDKASKGDEKRAAKLARYASPEAAIDGMFEAQTLISSGKLKPVLAKDATPEDVAAWRKENGIPEAPDKYDLAGVKDLLDTDKPILDRVLKVAHDNNLSVEATKALASVLPGVRQQVAEMQSERDGQAREKTEEALRGEWGAEFKRHMNVIHGVLDSTMPADVKGAFLGARLPDGSLLGNHPEILRGLLSLALIKNPTGIVVPGGSGNPAQGVNDEIAKIEKTMRENRTAYNKDTAMQERYLKLIEARQKLAA